MAKLKGSLFPVCRRRVLENVQVHTSYMHSYFHPTLMPHICTDCAHILTINARWLHTGCAVPAIPTLSWPCPTEGVDSQCSDSFAIPPVVCPLCLQFEGAMRESSLFSDIHVAS